MSRWGVLEGSSGVKGKYAISSHQEWTREAA